MLHRRGWLFYALCLDNEPNMNLRREMYALKRWLLMLAVLLPILAACGGTPPTDEAPEAPTTGDEVATTAEGAVQVDPEQLSDELYFYNWPDYLDPSIIADFEAEYGVRVVEDYYDSNEAMLARLRAGNSGYDLVAPSDYAIETMITEDLLAPLNTDLLPNMRHLNPDLMGLYYDPDNQYSLPYFWGTTGLAYNTQHFDEPPTSWGILFEPAHLEAVEGQFTMLNDSRETPGAALIYLGYPLNSTDEAQLAEAEALLLMQKPYVASYDSSSVNLKLANEEIILAHTWSGMAGQAISGVGDKPGNPNIAYLIPDEGGVIWQDNLAIVGDSPNQYTAHVFINYLMRPDIAARNTDYVLYLPSNLAARELLADETKALFAAGLEPEPEAMDRLEWVRRNEETATLYSDLWTRVSSL